jgi:uncharacterized protein (TIRG00374 family)
MTNSENVDVLAANKSKPSPVKQLAGVLIALLFLWFAFRGADPQKLWQYAHSIQVIYLLPLFVCGLISHVLRAVRWQILLAPVAGRKPGLFNTFTAVIIGYAVNIILPRGGEVARLISICRTENLSWAGVLPTMFIDRLLDIVVLVLLLGATLNVIPPQFLSTLPWINSAGLTLCAVSIIGLVLLPRCAQILRFIVKSPVVSGKIPEKYVQLALKLAGDFEAGTACLTNPMNYPAIAILSLSIWFCYWLNVYIMVLAFNLQSVVSLVQSLIVFTIGSIGVLVPTPGSVGSYHFLVSQGLMLICGLNKDQALTFATVLHLFSFVVVAVVPAAVCVFISSNMASAKQRNS